MKNPVRITALVATGLLGPLAWAAPGDLDPTFGDLGRVGPLDELPGAAWTLELLAGDEFILGGGDFRAEDDGTADDVSGFARRLSAAGAIDPAFTAPALAGIQVRDLARESGGRIVGVGTSVEDGHSTLVVFRLEPDGGLDPGFGDAGTVRYASAESNYGALSLAIDADGRIVVAGRRDGALIVLALDASGSVDTAFGDAGQFVGPVSSCDVQPLRTASGGYRFATSSLNPRNPELYGGRPTWTTKVLGLTAAGTLDPGFGSAGATTISLFSSRCLSMVEQADGSLFIVDNSWPGFAIRLDTNGDLDEGFSTDALAGSMTRVTAMAVAANGSILVAGNSADAGGAVILRLLATGELDPRFGNLGRAWVDVAAEFGSAPVIREITPLPDGGALLAGSDRVEDTPRSFVARLVGDEGRGSPGVLGVLRSPVAASEESGPATVQVRRTGGSLGAVRVRYQTRPQDATEGVDYTAVQGELQWADGDTSDREIAVPIAVDTDSELPERFDVVLSDPQGGASLGSRASVVEILPKGYPGGVLGLEFSTTTVAEGASVQVTVHRDLYSVGDVSVALMTTSGTASAQDFDPYSIVVSWADGDTSPQTITLAVVDDADDEPVESFTVELVDPSGGAAIGAQASGTITINDNDLPANGGTSSGSSGGGGAAGLSLLLMLFAAGLSRWGVHTMRRKIRRVCVHMILACGALSAAGTSADPVLWDSAAGGNGHLYHVVRVGTPHSWSSARAAARALGPGWDLATITTAQENAFVRGLFEADPTYHRPFTRCPDADICWYWIGPWIGGFNVTEQRHFEWVTGESVAFTDWGTRTFGPQGHEVAYLSKYFGKKVFTWATPATVFYPTAYIAEKSGSPELSSLALKKSTVAGCVSVTATVTIPQPAPLQGVVVKLGDTLASASSPASATIPAGASSASFTIRTSPVVTNETGSISAMLGGTTLRQPLTVRPIGILYLTLSPATVTGGGKVIATARLECRAAPGPITLRLGSSDPAIANTVAPAIVVPQGVQSETFDITTSRVTGPSAVSIKATANGLSKSKKLNVTP